MPSAMKIAGKDVETGPWALAGVLVLAAVGVYALVRWAHVDACDLFDEETASRVLGAPAKRGSSCSFVSEGRNLQISLNVYPSNEEAAKAMPGDSFYPMEAPVGFELARPEHEAGLGDKAFSFEIHSRLHPPVIAFIVVKGRRRVQVLASTTGNDATELRTRTRRALETAVKKMPAS